MSGDPWAMASRLLLGEIARWWPGCTSFSGSRLPAPCVGHVEGIAGPHVLEAGVPRLLQHRGGGGAHGARGLRGRQVPGPCPHPQRLSVSGRKEPLLFSTATRMVSSQWLPVAGARARAHWFPPASPDTDGVSLARGAHRGHDQRRFGRVLARRCRAAGADPAREPASGSARHGHCRRCGRGWEARPRPSGDTVVTQGDEEGWGWPEHPDAAPGPGPAPAVAPLSHQ